MTKIITKLKQVWRLFILIVWTSKGYVKSITIYGGQNLFNLLLKMNIERVFPKFANDTVLIDKITKT